ncbi:diacylglycerol kinase [Candidatus Uhrbacteria bacterium]|nr:diacylglycerol kinase [Candidatus Uhrbacteria bacterium]
MMISPKKVIRSFRHALRGTVKVFREEHSFRVELVAAAAVTVLMFAFGLRTSEKAILVLVMLLVLVLELVNSVFERIADMLKPRFHPYVEDLKDIMAATVLVSAVGAVAIGLLIFWPYIVK